MYEMAESTLTTEVGAEAVSPEGVSVVNHVIPPMAYDPNSESADEDVARPEEERTTISSAESNQFLPEWTGHWPQAFARTLQRPGQNLSRHLIDTFLDAGVQHVGVGDRHAWKLRIKYVGPCCK